MVRSKRGVGLFYIMEMEEEKVDVLKEASLEFIKKVRVETKSRDSRDCRARRIKRIKMFLSSWMT